MHASMSVRPVALSSFVSTTFPCLFSPPFSSEIHFVQYSLYLIEVEGFFQNNEISLSLLNPRV